MYPNGGCHRSDLVGVSSHSTLTVGASGDRVSAARARRHALRGRAPGLSLVGVCLALGEGPETECGTGTPLATARLSNRLASRQLLLSTAQWHRSKGCKLMQTRRFSDRIKSHRIRRNATASSRGSKPAGGSAETHAQRRRPTAPCARCGSQKIECLRANKIVIDGPRTGRDCRFFFLAPESDQNSSNTRILVVLILTRATFPAH